MTTPLVAFLDSDDLLLPTALAELRAGLLAAPRAPFAFGKALIARSAAVGWEPEGLIGPLPHELTRLPGALFARNFVPSSGALIRTEAARAVRGFPTAAYFNEDFYFWVYLSLRGEPAHVPAIVSVYRVHPGNRFVPSGGRDYELVAEIGRRHAALAPHLATHFGGRLCEHAIDAVHRRDALSLLRGTAQILRLTPNRARTLNAAVRYLRIRRLVAEAGTRAWKANPELRAWLASYAAVGTTESETGAGVSGSM